MPRLVGADVTGTSCQCLTSLRVHEHHSEPRLAGVLADAGLARNSSISVEREENGREVKADTCALSDSRRWQRGWVVSKYRL